MLTKEGTLKFSRNFLDRLFVILFFFLFVSIISSSVKTWKYLLGRNTRNVILESSVSVTTIECPKLVVIRTAFIEWYRLFFWSSLVLIAWLQVAAENRLMSSICQRTWFYTSVSFTAQIYSATFGDCYCHILWCLHVHTFHYSEIRCHIRINIVTFMF